MFPKLPSYIFKKMYLVNYLSLFWCNAIHCKERLTCETKQGPCIWLSCECRVTLSALAYN